MTKSSDNNHKNKANSPCPVRLYVACRNPKTDEETGPSDKQQPPHILHDSHHRKNDGHKNPEWPPKQVFLPPWCFVLTLLDSQNFLHPCNPSLPFSFRGFPHNIWTLPPIVLGVESNIIALRRFRISWLLPDGTLNRRGQPVFTSTPVRREDSWFSASGNGRS